MRRVITRAVLPIALLLVGFAPSLPLLAQADGQLVQTAKPAPTASLAPLFDPASPTVDIVQNGTGVVSYVYFQAQRNLTLQKFVLCGQPQNLNVGSSIYLDLFQTTSAWQTPDGNGDRIFSVVGSLEDLGRNYYEVTVPTARLQARAYYFLMFQVNNMDWIQPTATNDSQTSPFATDDGRIAVYWSCNPNLGPCEIRTPLWFLGTHK